MRSGPSVISQNESKACGCFRESDILQCLTDIALVLLHFQGHKT